MGWLRMIIVIISLLLLNTYDDDVYARPSTAYMSEANCFSLLDATPGARAGFVTGMSNNAQTLQSVTGNNCVLTSDIPAEGYEPCGVYTATMTSTKKIGHILAINAGFMGNAQDQTTDKIGTTCRGTTDEISVKVKIQAPGNSSTVFKVAGACGNFDIMFAASPIVSSIKPNATGPVTCVDLTSSSFSNAFSLQFIMIVAVVFINVMITNAVM